MFYPKFATRVKTEMCCSYADIVVLRVIVIVLVKPWLGPTIALFVRRSVKSIEIVQTKNLPKNYLFLSTQWIE
jgi:flagellar biosynthesis protein FliQ